MIQVFGFKKCKNTQKALRYFKERHIETQFRDMDIKPPSAGEIDAIASLLGGASAMIDTDCAAAKERGLSYMDYDPKDELLRDPRLYKTPLVRLDKKKASSGLDEASWAEMAKG